MQISINLPDTKNLSEVDQGYLIEALAATLYHIGKISEQEACEITGKTRRDFEEILPKFGFSILADTQENMKIELNAS